MSDKPKAAYEGFTFEDSDIANLDDFIPGDDSYNPHHVRPWLIYSALGTRAVAFASDLQDALDAAVDADKLDADLVSDEELAKMSSEEVSGLSYLGNAGEPFRLDDVDAIELPNPPMSFVALFNARPGTPRHCNACGSPLDEFGLCKEEAHTYCRFSRHAQGCREAEKEENWIGLSQPQPRCMCHMLKQTSAKYGGKDTVKLTREERLLLIEEVYTKLILATESFEPGNIGMELAYLFGAIAKCNLCEWSGNSAIVQLLQQNFHQNHPVWRFIEIEVPEHD